MFDVVTLGETMIRLTPPELRRIEQTEMFHAEVGGSESNVAVGLARLGLRSCWVSRLTDNSLGRMITGMLTRYGVDTSHVVWTDKDRVGLYFYEPAPLPRGNRVIYDRARSAMSQIMPEELPLSLFSKGAAKLLHLTGITPILSPSAHATSIKALTLAKQTGWRVCFDVNYRSKLASVDEALEKCLPFMQSADILLMSFSDAKLFFQATSPQNALEELRKIAPSATIALTMGAEGAVGLTPDNQIVKQDIFVTQAVERIGGGDAFATGFIYRYLQDNITDSVESVSEALRWGAACAALKYGIKGDLPLIDYADVLALVNGNQSTGTIMR
jgi:2-dehydro-3-deoxygluconokinase